MKKLIKSVIEIRQIEWVVLAILTVIIVVAMNSPMAYGWGSESLIKITMKFIELVIFYYATRRFLHRRTHELRGLDLAIREGTLILGIGLIIAL